MRTQKSLVYRKGGICKKLFGYGLGINARKVLKKGNFHDHHLLHQQLSHFSLEIAYVITIRITGNYHEHFGLPE